MSPRGDRNGGASGQGRTNICRAGAAEGEGSAAVDIDVSGDRAGQRQIAGIDGGCAGVGVRSRERQRARPGVSQAADAADDAGDSGDGVGIAKLQPAVDAIGAQERDVGRRQA